MLDPPAMFARICADDFDVDVSDAGILSNLLPFAPSQLNGIARVRRDADAVAEDVACNAVCQAISLALNFQRT